jgi:hypothetical protein
VQPDDVIRHGLQQGQKLTGFERGQGVAAGVGVQMQGHDEQHQNAKIPASRSQSRGRKDQGKPVSFRKEARILPSDGSKNGIFTLPQAT